jgi:hypothetical protein
MKQMNGYIDRPMDDYSAACNLQSKLWVSVALKKANIAVLYDERGQFRNAIFYYSEAVGLLHKAINNPQDLKSEIEGLAIIVTIFFLSFLIINIWFFHSLIFI